MRRERFTRHRLKRKPLVRYPGMHHDAWVTHVPWCMSGSLTRVGWENVPGACATRNFMQEAHTLSVHYNGPPLGPRQTARWPTVCAIKESRTRELDIFLMSWPLCLRFLKAFYLISWWLTLYLCWVIRFLLIKLATTASTLFYNSLNSGASPLTKGIAFELW